jgi:MinD-like ATPase involved in chromosome partitioning or flagellar assembly
MQEKRVVAAEIRSCYGTFSAQLNLVQPQGLTGLLALDPGKIGEREVRSHMITLPSGLRLLVGPQHVAENREIEPHHLEIIIKIITSMVDYAILDLPNYPSAANQTAIQSCDLIALVTEPLSSSLLSGIKTIEQLRSWGVQGRRLGVIVVNRAPYAAPSKIDQISAQLGTEIIGVIPTASDIFITAQQVGLPVVIYRPDSDVSRALTEITKKISPVAGWIR